MENNNKIHFIDKKVTDKMSILDLNNNNIFTDYLSLIMNFSPYIDRIVFGKTMKTTDYHIIYVERGNATIKFNMMEYELKQGSLVFLNKNSIIITKRVSPDYNPLTVGFDTPAVVQKYEDLTHHDTVFIQTSGKDSESVLNSFNLLYNFAKNSKRMDVGLEAMLVAILNIVNNLRDTEIYNISTSIGSRNRIVKLFFYYLNIEEYPERNVQSYADKIGISSDHLARTLKKETCHSPLHWINKRTIQMAQFLLCDNPKMSLEDIALSLHCGSAANLIKLYKRETGETPGMYRTRYA